MRPLRSWGVSFSDAISHSADLCCPKCGWRDESYCLDIVKMTPYLVGFTTEMRKDDESPGGFIFECPECFEKFWYHAGRSSIDLLVFLNSWPK